MPLSPIRASLLAIPVHLLHGWQIGLFVAALVHEREHPALALLVLAPLLYVLLNLTHTLHPIASMRQLSSEQKNFWKDLAGVAPVPPLSRPWLGRVLLVFFFCVVGTITLAISYGSLHILRNDVKAVTATLQGWILIIALGLLTFFLYGPLWRAFKRFARASGLTDSGPWRALLTGMGVWLWCDAIFAAIHQHVSLICRNPQVIGCRGSAAFTQDLTSFPQALYFSTMTLATVGYGDVAPVAGLARALVTIEVVIGIGLLGFILGRVVSFVPSSNKDKT